MISALNGTISALRAFVTKLGVTADNIANVNTDGFKRNRAVLHEDLSGGVRVQLSKDQSPGLRYDVIEDGQKIEKETPAAEDISAEKTTPEMSIVEKQEKQHQGHDDENHHGKGMRIGKGEFYQGLFPRVRLGSGACRRTSLGTLATR